MTAEEHEEPVSPEELIPTRASLLERLRLWSDNKSWQEFFDTYWKLIYKTARAAGLSPVESEEAVQETIISVAKRMPDFRYKPLAQGGSFKRWLFKVMKWRVADQLRRRRRDAHLVSLDLLTDDTGEPFDVPDTLSAQLDAQWEAAWEQNLMEVALERLKRRVDPAHYQIFQLQVAKKWPGVKVAKHLGVSISQTYTVKCRLVKELEKIIADLRQSGEAE